MVGVTAMCDDLGQRGDVAVGAMILEAHRECGACRAGTCETGAYAAELLAEHRRERAEALGRR
ncbi:hypothetical protein O7602_26570 [Micromonospora sp. WMMD1128]|uniref:hypothetical protein n=1 Tax=Micromonospora sp. WMMD1128 TaxID=3015150 RepID=UPI00248AA2FB|nr:hypothetical protein [Micromonospora sp. WMMD1128]WBB73208.1 hypothetical protein O7602_26570 [Micromonospora sp. WMMD1128]